MESDRLVSATSEGLNIGDGAQRMRASHGRTTGPTRRSTKGQWTAEEDEILRKAVQRFKGKNWKKIAECFKDRTDVQCLHRWQKVLNPELVKGPWSKEEDEIIIELVKKFGPKKWSTIAQHLPGRIGKQCRERWHNHLNPGINKEAWTQEEELALIRAHQLYGNRWAELTKFLPGRTDNAIKNHWNSSVKKKLDSYLASGLLDQFQQFPLVAYQNQHIPSSSSRMQSSVDESALNGRTDAEEISECSQDSARMDCSQSANELAVVMHPGDQFQHIEMKNASRDQIPGPASCSEPYYVSLNGTAFFIPDVPSEAGCSSMFSEQNFSHDGGASTSVEYQFNMQHTNISSLEMGHNSSGLTTHSIGNIGGQELVYAPNFIENMVEIPDKQEHLLITATDDDCFRILFSDTADDVCFSSENFTESSNVVDLGACTNPSPSRPSEQISDTGRIRDSLSPCPATEVLGTSCGQSFIPAPSILPADGSILICGREHGDSPLGAQGQDFICTDDPANSPCHDADKDSLKLVPVNSFGSGSDANEACPPPVVEKPKTHTEQDAGALCYEPPRFPSLDIPFFSCDLVQSGSDMQLEYSPLGIRQLMTNSTHCVTPFRLWDSPSRDDNPNALLRSAAKTFTGTPSILKKRHRDLLSPSPLSEGRIDKKLETDLTSNLAKDFSRLDVEFDNDDTQKLSQLPQTDDHKNNSDAPIEGKENLNNVFAEREDSRKDTTALSDDSDAKTRVGDADAHQNQSYGVLVDHNINDLLLFSPDQAGSRVEKSFASTARTPKNQLHKSSGVMSNQSHASENSSVIQGTSSSAPLEISVANSGNDAVAESYIIFGETPFKRSIESPSAWKSPWFLNSFLPGQMEDIGYLLSPGDKSYDAIGLMKQLSDFSAPSYADALEVLGNETPETLLKQKRDFNPDIDKENNNVTQNQTESCLHLPSNNLTERRVLDFSECGTPGKGIENKKSSAVNGISISSPSSYLLKSCR